MITNLSSECIRQIDPTGVLALNQFYFPVPAPFLELFLSGNGQSWIVENFEIDKLVHPISHAEPRHQLELMRMHTAYDVIGDADV